MIRIEGASVRHGHHVALHPTTLALDAGTLTVVAGPNGAGKSTLLKVMTGETVPATGRVLLADEDIARFKPAVLARRRAVLPQSSTLAFPFTVGEVVRLGLDAGGRRGDAAAVEAALARVDLGDFAGRFYQELSGGEQQRVHLARVLCQIGPAVAGGQAHALFLDEPVSSLDIRHQLAVLGIAADFARDGGCVVAVLHDLNLAAAFADRLVVLSKGAVVADGPPAEVVTDDMLASVFRVSLRVGVLPPSGIPFVLPQTGISP